MSPLECLLVKVLQQHWHFLTADKALPPWSCACSWSRFPLYLQYCLPSPQGCWPIKISKSVLFSTTKWLLTAVQEPTAWRTELPMKSLAGWLPDGRQICLMHHRAWWAHCCNKIKTSHIVHFLGITRKMLFLFYMLKKWMKMSEL